MPENITPIPSFPLLIGLSGKKRRGKDTLGAVLVRDYGFTRFAIADALKQAALDVDPYVASEDRKGFIRLSGALSDYGTFEGLKDSIWNDSVRELLQRMGAVMALRDNNFWAAPVVAAALHHVNSTGQGAVITDVRFPWEVDMIRDSFGSMVRVLRSDLPDSLDADSHISETMLDAIVPDEYFDTSPLDVSFSSRAGVLLRSLMINNVAGSSLQNLINKV
jgi:hypothetical protein